MNVLHVNNVDLLGNRFNGHDMQRALNARGIRADQVVMDRMGDDPHTISLAARPDEPYFRNRLMECERELSLHAMLYPYLFRLMDMPVFQAANVVHYHLLHNYFGALPILPEITRRKPAVLTIHDPWLFTGHCIYPLECDRWISGCGNCGQMGLNFPMKDDRTALQWSVKRDIFAHIDIDIVVASPYMLDLTRSSPITAHMEHIHLIPFGIDTELFLPRENRRAIRERLGIPECNFVLFFRADPSPYKGFGCIKQMLDRLAAEKPVTLLAVGNQGMLNEYKNRYQIVDFGWITDNEFLSELYCASDLFLMPSTAEAFGLMAIEAMASGIPVLVCEGTSLPSVTFAPDCGVAIPQNDSAAMCRAVKRLISNPDECRARGEMGRRLAVEHYQFDSYIDHHIRLYEEITSRR